MDSRTDWPDSRINDLARKVNGMPETVATHTVQLKELADDVHAIRALLEEEGRARVKATESIRELIDAQGVRRDTNRTLKVAAFITAGLALVGSLLGSVVTLVTQL